MGELAAISVAFCWAFTSIFLTAAGTKLGAVVVNRIRLVFAVLFLMTAHVLSQGQLFPSNVEPFRWFWLGISGIIGLVLGDAFLIQSYIYVGVRIGTLIMSSVPVISTFFAWIFLKESLQLFEIIGILIVISGIILVVSDKKNDNTSSADQQLFSKGILMAFLGAFGQATGLVLAKKGLVGNFSPLSGVLIRMIVAMITIWLVAIFTRKALPTLKQAINDRKAVLDIAIGSFVGPFIGVWLSLIAVQSAQVGIASTLMALTPIITLPIAKKIYNEKISRNAILGTITALMGVMIIFVFPG